MRATNALKPPFVLEGDGAPNERGAGDSRQDTNGATNHGRATENQSEA
jgi:hypothetical protein